MTSNATQKERVMAEASAWLARLQRDGVSAEDGLEFDAWLDAAPANRAAYAQAVALLHEFESAAGAILAELDSEQPRPNVVPLRRRGHSRAWFAGVGGLAVAAGLAVTLLPPMLMEPTPQTYVTAKGQHQRVALADGSVLDINAETRLSVSLGRKDRKVILSEGEAIFDVAHDERRPFTVQAAGRVVRDVGTQFDVRSRKGALVVTVAQGRVEIRPVASGTSGGSYLLTPGQRLEVGQTGVEAVKIVDPQEALSWRAGRLVYRDQPLADVVADLNRQFPEQIEIGDAELGKTPITGVVVLDDPHSVIARLSLMLPIRSVPSERGLLLLRK